MPSAAQICVMVQGPVVKAIVGEAGNVVADGIAMPTTGESIIKLVYHIHLARYLSLVNPTAPITFRKAAILQSPVASVAPWVASLSHNAADASAPRELI